MRRNVVEALLGALAGLAIASVIIAILIGWFVLAGAHR